VHISFRFTVVMRWSGDSCHRNALTVIAEIVGSNPAGGKDVCVVFVVLGQ
jgi:hypothetical protein